MRPLRILSILLFLLIWEIAALIVALPQLFPTPVDVIIALKDLLVAPGPAETVWAGELMGNTIISLWRVIVGFSIAAISGVFLGIIIGYWQKARDLLEPVIEIMRPIPPLAWIPLAILWFGLGFKPAVWVCALVSALVGCAL
ncbi:MAG: hypothetical protein NTZ34_07210 [Chloroflexi bacterium]|nr:hypothetical protein [Chloroflexota bacterium]